jgi:hypothetical protein
MGRLWRRLAVNIGATLLVVLALQTHGPLTAQEVVLVATAAAIMGTLVMEWG